jgi:hypothetical protein
VSDSPDWIADGLKQVRDELTLFAKTVWAFTASPAISARGWADGSLRLLNPLGFIATSFGVVGVVMTTLLRLLHMESDATTSLAVDILKWIGPYIYYVALGMVAHGVLRLWSGGGQLRGTLAIALYAGGGPAMVIDVFVRILALLWQIRLKSKLDDSSTFGTMVVMASFSAFCFSFSSGLRALNERLRLWHIWCANLLAMLATGIIFGVFHPPGQYGFHLTIGLERTGDVFHVNFGFGN